MPSCAARSATVAKSPLSSILFQRNARASALMSVSSGLPRAWVPDGRCISFRPPRFTTRNGTWIHDPEARGTILGLSLNHDIRHLWRALLEGYAYAFRHHIEVFNEMGLPTTRYLASDGGSKSRLWMQICADALQMPIRLLTGHPGSCLGAAWVAAMGSGVAENWNGVADCVSYGEEILPDQARKACYDAGYARFRDAYCLQKEQTK